MKKTVILGSIAAAGLSLFTASAFAGDRSDRMDKRWERLDANGDGELTVDEMTARQADLVAKADADGSGGVSREEMLAYREAQREARHPDKNDDGVVDRTEFINAAQDRFDRLDENGDGVLSEDEQKRYRAHGRRGRG